MEHAGAGRKAVGSRSTRAPANKDPRLPPAFFVKRLGGPCSKKFQSSIPHPPHLHQQLASAAQLDHTPP